MSGATDLRYLDGVLLAVCGVDHAGHSVPVAPLVRVVGLGVPGRSETGEHVLDWPLKVVETHGLGTLLVDGGNVVAEDADERETDSLNEYVMNLCVYEDIIHVKLDKLYFDVREGLWLHNGGVRNLKDLSVVGTCLGWWLLECLGAAREGVLLEVSAWELECEEGLVLKIDGDETVAIRNRDRRDRKTDVLVEPETELVPDLESGLGELRSLRTVDDGLLLAAHLDLGVAVDGWELVVGGVGVGDAGLDWSSVSLVGDFLTDKAVVASALVWWDTELLEHGNSVVIVLVKRISVNLEVSTLKQAVTRVLAVTGKILVGASGVVAVSLIRRTADNLAKGVNDLVVGTGTVRWPKTARWAAALINTGNVNAGNLRKAHVAYHVVEEISKGRNRESDD